jgi:hypothetical protein
MQVHVQHTRQTLRDRNMRWSLVSLRARWRAELRCEMWTYCLTSGFDILYDHHDPKEVVCFSGSFSLSDIVHLSSEGVQIGGVCGAAGVVGTWSGHGGAHHEQSSSIHTLFARGVAGHFSHPHSSLRLVALSMAGAPSLLPSSTNHAKNSSGPFWLFHRENIPKRYQCAVAFF